MNMNMLIMNFKRRISVDQRSQMSPGSDRIDGMLAIYLFSSADSGFLGCRSFEFVRHWNAPRELLKEPKLLGLCRVFGMQQLLLLPFLQGSRANG